MMAEILYEAGYTIHDIYDKDSDLEEEISKLRYKTGKSTFEDFLGFLFSDGFTGFIS
jgi:hypothetical protein